MHRRGWLGTAVVVVALAIFAAFPAMAVARTYVNSECRTCHPEKPFTVGKGNYATACRKCHDDSLAGAHPYHNSDGNCGAVCHPSWGDSLISNVPSYIDTGGAFASAQSQGTSAALLHIIHSKPRWPAGMDRQTSRCGSCHAVAACETCHDSNPQVDATHANHASIVASANAAWVGDLSYGVTAGDQTIDTHQKNAVSRCGSPACHDTAGVRLKAPGLQDDFSHVADPTNDALNNVVTTAGTWKTHFANVYTRGEELVSNVDDSTFSTTFTGNGVTLVADKDPFRGIAEVSIDGTVRGTVDLFRDTTLNQVEVWSTSGLSAGSHTISVRVTGMKNPQARSTHVSIDEIKVYANTPGSVSPQCISCHPGRGDSCATSTFTHEASGTAGNGYKLGTYATYRCDSCHSMFLRTEHERTSSSSAGRACNACHVAYAPLTPTGTWKTNDGCNYTTCHTAGTSREVHTSTLVTAGHAPTTDANEASCRGCHAGDLAGVHNNSVTTNAYVTNCNTCHTPTRYPTSKSCSDMGVECHATSGVVSVDSHTFDIPRHTSTSFSSASQGGTTTIDAGGFECSACHTARLDQTHATTSVGAVGCTSGGTGAKGCHNDTALNSMAVASAGWPQEKCLNCHNYGTNRSHDATAAPHQVPAGTCAGSATGCHTSTDLWVIHSKNHAGGAPKYNSCANAGCHDAANVNKRPTITACGSGNGGCHEDKVLGAHPSSAGHKFSPASNYNSAAETGCTNSGAGCHGMDSTYADFSQTYHKRTGCVGGTCHMSPSKTLPAFTGQPTIDCQGCHDSQFSSAPDRISLTALYPNGHYSDTTHTADATFMATTVSAGGTTTAMCRNCHNPAVGTALNGLYNQHQNVQPGSGSPYGTTVGCGECHNDTLNTAVAVIAAGWPSRRCDDCHQISGTVPFHGTSTTSVDDTATTSCGSTGSACHNTKDLHAIHKSAAGGCNLTGCHDYTKQAFVPTAKSCGPGGACHTGYTFGTSFTTHPKSQETTAHAPATTVQATDLFLGNQCDSCHIVSKTDGGLMAEHTLSTSTQTVYPGNICRNCHNNPASLTAVTSSWSAKNSNTACAQCHTGAIAVHADPNSTAHTAASAGCASSGPGCHPTSDLSSVGTPSTTGGIHSTCLRCHDRKAAGGNLAYNPANKTCGAGRACHSTGTQYNTSTAVHNGAGGLADGNDATHHTATGMDGVIGDGAASNVCSDCHSATLSTAHANTYLGAIGCNTGGTGNKGCHDSTVNSIAPVRVKDNWNSGSRLCVDCHTVGHTTIEVTHTGSSTQGCDVSGPGCHVTNSLKNLHKNLPGGVGCRIAGCHDPSNFDKRPHLKSCGQGGDCHTTYTSTGHGLRTGDDAVSHTTTDAAMLVDATGGLFTAKGNTCQDCHSASLQAAHTDVTTVLKSGNPAWPASPPLCANCHNSGLGGSPVDPVDSVTVIKTNRWSTQTCQECHDIPANGGNGNGWHLNYTTDQHTATLGTTGVADGCDGASCHKTRDVRTIHNRISSGCTAIGTDSNGWSGGCHAAQKNMTGIPMSCGQGSGGCHNNQTNTNHGARHTLDVANSDYNPATESGCTNSGTGCHGADTAARFAPYYHNDPGCKSGVCHSSPSQPAHATGTSHTCLECHDGTYVNAPNRTNLATAYPSGHYNETTHTATGQSMTATISAGGSASASCGNCHNPVNPTGPDGLAYQHTNVPVAAGSSYGTTVGCGECHNDTRNSGNAQVLANWSTRKCDSCHNLSGSAPMHGTPPVVTGTSPLGCGGTGINCHNTYNLHQIHRNASGGCGLTDAGGAKCHDFTLQAAKPTSTSCGTGGTCHTGYTVNTSFPTHTKNTESAKHAPTTTTQETQTWQGVQCGACHLISSADGGLLAEHSSTFSTRTTNATNICRNCHNNTYAEVASAIATGWAANRDTANACSQCHKATTIPIHTTVDTTKHTSTSTCGNSGPGCHPTNILSQVGTPSTTANIHSACTRCHDHNGLANYTIGGGNLKYDPTRSKVCGATGCHPSTLYTSTAHRVGRADLVDGNDATHHTAGSMTTSVGVYPTGGNNTCQTCHSATLLTAHATTSLSTAVSCSTGGTGNTGCHNSTTVSAAPGVVKASWAGKLCSDCHTAGTQHNNFTTASHTATTGSCTGIGSAGCHTTADVRTLHDKVGRGCTASGSDTKGTNPACHSLNKKMSGVVPMACGSGSGGCHTSHLNGNHGGDHDANKAAGVAAGTTGQTYKLGQNVGCFGCHYSDLREEHGTAAYTTGPSGRSAGRTMHGAIGSDTNGCNTCHNNHGGTAGAYAGSTAVVNARTNLDHRCNSCHNQLTDNATGVMAAHITSTTVGSIVKGQTDPTIEFQNWSRGGGHMAGSASYVTTWPATYKGLGVMSSAGTTVTLTSGLTYAGTLGGTNPRTATVWKQGDMMLCSDCHYGAPATGPQGAAVPFYLNGSAATFPIPAGQHWYESVLSGTRPALCTKCHTTYSSIHSASIGGYNHNTANFACSACHITIPHAWKRPRLLRRTAVGTWGGISADTAPYISTARVGLQGFKVTATMTNIIGGTGNKANCYSSDSGCSSGHATAATPYWP